MVYVLNHLTARAAGYILISVLLLVFLATSAAAQETTTSAIDGRTPSGLQAGSPAGTYSLSGFDNVNLFNGNLNFHLPLLSVGGRGNAGYTMTLALNLKGWHVRHTHKEFPDGNTFDSYKPQASWGSGGGYGVGSLSYRSSGLQTATNFSCGNYYSKTLSRLTFSTADGTEYELRDQLSGGAPLNSTCTQGAYRGTVFVTADGTSTTYISDAPIYDNPKISGIGPQGFSLTGYLLLRDGTRYRIDNGNVTWIRDSNGNKVSFTYTTNSMVITDSLNRTVTVNYSVSDVAPYGLCDQIIFKGFDGAQRIIHVSHTNLGSALRPNSGYSIKTLGGANGLFPELNGSSTTTYDPTVTSTVWLPDDGVNHRSYKFNYNDYGELARVELPTGGAVEYDMTPGSGVVCLGSCGVPEDDRQIYRRVVERRIYPDGSTGATFEHKDVYANSEAVGTASSTVTVEQRSQSGTVLTRSRHYFDGSALDSMFVGDVSSPYGAWYEGNERQTDTLDTFGDIDNATVLRRVVYARAQRASVPWWPSYAATYGLNVTKEPPNDPRLIEIDTTLSDTNQMSEKTFSYDQYNNQTDAYEYDNGAPGTGTPGAFIRRTHIDYIPDANYVNASVDPAQGAHMRGLPLRQWVSSDIEGNNKQALAEYEYDNYTPSANHTHEALMPRPSISGLCATFSAGGQCDDPSDPNTNPAAYVLRGNVTSVTRFLLSGGVGSVTLYQQYDVAGNIVVTIDPRGRDATDARAFAMTFDFSDHFGTPDMEARSNTSPAELAAQGQKSYAFPTLVTNALGHTSYMQYDYYTGSPVNSEDVNGTVASASYNDPLDRTKRVERAVNVPALHAQITVDYDDTNHIVTTSGDLNALDDNLLKRQTLYDGMGRVTETRQYETSTTYITSLLTYDALGRGRRAYNRFRTTTDSTYGFAETTYDALSRVTRVETFDANATSTGAVTTGYAGNTVTITDQAGKKKRVETDAMGRIRSVTEPNDLNSLDAADSPVTTYDYDAMDNLRKVQQGGQQRLFMYDSLGRLIRAKGPEQDDASNGSFTPLTDPVTGNSHWSLAYSYDPADNLQTSIDARNVRADLTYDALNRVTFVNYSDQTPDVTYSYDTATAGKGRLASVSNSVSSYGYTSYDELGRVTACSQVTNVPGAGGQSVQHSYGMAYGYDLAGHLTSETYPSGRVIHTEYDTSGRLAGVKDNQVNRYYAGASPTDTTNRVQYAAHGAASAMRLGNGLWEHMNFNSRLQPTQIGLGQSKTDSTQLQLDYFYGTTQNNGNLLSQTISVPGQAAFTQAYGYDSLNRLQSAEEMSGTTSNWKQLYSYDRFGNRALAAGTTLPNSLNATNNPSISQTNNRIDAADYSYDEAGNLKQAPSYRYSYDAESRIVSADGVNGQTNWRLADYAYDGEGRRVLKVTGGQTPQTTVFVYNAMGQLVAEYSTLVTTGGTSYLTTDGLGSARVVTDSTGQVAKARHDYLPFGEELTAGTGGRTTQQGYSQPDGTRQRFVGSERDGETGLDYMQARYYASAQGRFTSPDPIMISDKQTFNPQLWNLYNYVGNNPLAYTDPTGMELVRLGQHTDEEIEARRKAIDEEKKAIRKDSSLTKAQQDERRAKLEAEKQTLGLEKEGNKVVGQELASLQAHGELNGLKLSDFTLSTDSKHDFDADPRVSDDPGAGAGMFVLNGYSTQIYVNKNSNDYQGAQGGDADFITYGGTAARHEQVHRDGDASKDRSEHAAYTVQLRILQKYGPDAFKSKDFYKTAIDHVTAGSKRKD